MLPTTHLLAGAVCGALGARQGILSPGMAAGTVAAAVLIDLDHWIAFAYKTGSANVFRAWNSSIRRDGRSVRTFIHDPAGVAFIALFLGLLFWRDRATGYMLGSAYFSHIALDYFPDRRHWSIHFSFGKILLRTTPVEIVLTLVFIALLIAVQV